MGTGFTQRLISVGVQLAPNTQTNQPNSFVQNGMSVGDMVNLTGVRTSVRVQNSGAPADCRAQVKVWGMTPSLMNQLATLGLALNLVPRNSLTIRAGQLVAGVPQLSSIFTGTIVAAYGDYEAQPDVPFIFDCNLGLSDAVNTTPPTSFPQPFDVATAMAGFARQMNIGFMNSGNVNITLPPMYFSGSAKVQADKCADAAGINWGTPNFATLEIWPRGGNRNTPNLPVISKATGMVGYPAFTKQGIIVKTLFNPLIAFGGLIQVESSLLSGIASAQAASAAQTFPTQWAVNKLDMMLDTLLPKGQWLSTIYAYNPGYAKGIIPPTT